MKVVNAISHFSVYFRLLTEFNLGLKMEIIDLTLCRLSHLPLIFSNEQRLASWSDIKELCLWCPNPRCMVVLNALKCLLRYPESNQHMHPCSQLEHLLFLKKFVVVLPGTLLVNIDVIQKKDVILTLYQMVKQKHAQSNDQDIMECSNIFAANVNTYCNVTFKIPLKCFKGKKVLPAVRRVDCWTSAFTEPLTSVSDEKEYSDIKRHEVERLTRSLKVCSKYVSAGYIHEGWWQSW